MTAEILEFKKLTITANEFVSDKVEGKPTSKGQSGNNVRWGNKGMSSRVSIVLDSEVIVVESDNCIN